MTTSPVLRPHVIHELASLTFTSLPHITEFPAIIRGAIMFAPFIQFALSALPTWFSKQNISQEEICDRKIVVTYAGMTGFLLAFVASDIYVAAWSRTPLEITLLTAIPVTHIVLWFRRTSEIRISLKLGRPRKWFDIDTHPFYSASRCCLARIRKVRRWRKSRYNAIHDITEATTFIVQTHLAYSAGGRSPLMLLDFYCTKRCDVLEWIQTTFNVNINASTCTAIQATGENPLTAFFRWMWIILAFIANAFCELFAFLARIVSAACTFVGIPVPAFYAGVTLLALVIVLLCWLACRYRAVATALKWIGVFVTPILTSTIWSGGQAAASTVATGGQVAASALQAAAEVAKTNPALIPTLAITLAPGSEIANAAQQALTDQAVRSAASTLLHGAKDIIVGLVQQRLIRGAVQHAVMDPSLFLQRGGAGFV